MFLRCSHILNYFGNIYGVYGSRFGEIVGSSKNHPKSIAICPGTLISHLRIIKTIRSKKEKYTIHKNIVVCLATRSAFIIGELLQVDAGFSFINSSFLAFKSILCFQKYLVQITNVPFHVFYRC